MTPTTQGKLDEAISYIETIAITGGPKLRKLLSGLASSAKTMEILDIATRPENFYWSWPNWKPAARAWMLTALVRDQHWIYGDWQKPNEGVIQGYLNDLKTKYKPEIDEDIKTYFSFGPGLKSLESLQESSKRKLWGAGSFTNPNQHNDAKFYYVVYAMTAQTGMPFVKDTSDTRSDYVKSKMGNYLAQDKGGGWTLNCAEMYLDHPTILTTELLSCSIISHEHTKTYRNAAYGFILSVPYQNVCVASSRDLALDNSSARSDKLSTMGRGERMATVSSSIESLINLYNAELKSPKEILAECVEAKGAHNEVVIVGSISGLLVRPSAIFMKVTEDGHLLTSFTTEDGTFNLTKHIKACAHNHNIPIVAIKDNSGTASGILFSEWSK